MAFPYQVRSRMTLRLRVLFCILFVKNMIIVVCRRKEKCATRMANTSQRLSNEVG
jgi:hypothetical protein